MKQIYASGLDPVVLANWLKKGIEEEQLYIIPYPEEKQTLTKHFNRITESVLPMEADPEGVKKRMDAMKKITEEAMKNPGNMGPGFGKAKPDLDWVKNPILGPPPEKK